MDSSSRASVESLLKDRVWLRRLALAMAGDPHTADDLEQEAYLAAMRRPPRSEGALRAWLRRVMANRLSQIGRSNARRDRRERVAAQPEGTAPGDATGQADEVVARAEAQRRLVEAVFELDDTYRDTVLLRYFEELPTREVAQRMNVPEATVRQRSKRALDKLRGRLDRQYDSRRTWLALLGAVPVRTAWWPGVGAAAAAAALVLLAVFLVRGGDPRQERSDGASAIRSAAESGNGSSEMSAAGDIAVRFTRAGSAAWLSGEVRRAEDAQPVAAFEVELVASDGRKVAARTDAHGFFEFAAAAGGPYTVRAGLARAPGLHLGTRERRYLGTFWVGAPATLQAQVVDTAGRAVSEARVRVFRVERDAAWQDWAGHAPVAVAAARSGPDGRAALSLAPGTYAVRAERTGYAAAGRPRIVVRGKTPVRLVLERGHALSGRVFGVDGTPVSGATVLALRPREAGESRATPIDPLRFAARADEEGRYAFAALPRGAHALAVLPAGSGTDRAHGSLPARVGVIAIPGVKTYDIRLDGGVLFGRVTEAGTGRPLAGALVRVAEWRRHATTHAQARTDEDGRYEILLPLAGVVVPPPQGDRGSTERNLSVTKDGYVLVPLNDRTLWRHMWVRSGTRNEWNFRMREAATLHGVARGPEGPLPGVRVVADVWNDFRGSVSFRTVTDGAGRYAFPGLPAGRARVVALKPGFVQVPSAGSGWAGEASPDPRVVVRVPLRGEATLDLALEPGATLRGRVAGPAAAQVTVAAPGLPVLATTTAADGSFVVAGVPADAPLTVRAEAEGCEPAQAEAKAGEEVVLELKATGQLRGRVVRPAGASEGAGAFVQVATAKAALEGRYEVVDVWQRLPKYPVASDGAFAAPLPSGVGDGGAVVRAVAPGAAPALTAALAGDALSGVTIRLEAGHALRGRVLARDGSGPVSGARIEFVNETLPPGLGQRRDWRRTPNGRSNHPFEIVAMTGEDGAFELRDLPAWNYEVRVSAVGFGGTLKTVRLPADGVVAFELAPQHGIDGSVAYEDGAAAAGVLVQLVPQAPSLPGGQIRTDDAGRFEFVYRPAGSYKLRVVQDGLHSTDVLPFTSERAFEAGTSGVRLVVQRGSGSIRGRCVGPDGSPVPGAGLSAKPVSGGTLVRCRAGADGSFTLTGLERGPYTIAGAANRTLGGPEAFGNVIVTEARELAVGSDGVVLQFQRALPVSGRVLQADGAAHCVPALVRADAVPASAWRRFANVSQQDGTFALAALAPGSYKLTLIDQRTGKPLALDGPALAEAGRTDVVLRLKPGGLLAGKVTDDEGRPLPGVSVFARPRGAGETARARTDAKGCFSFAGLAQAAYDVVAVDDELGRAQAATEPGLPEIVLELKPAAALAGKLVDGDGKPIRAADIHAEQQGGTYVAELRTDSQGRFVTRAMKPGAYRIVLISREGKPLKDPKPCGTVRTGEADAVLVVR